MPRHLIVGGCNVYLNKFNDCSKAKQFFGTFNVVQDEESERIWTQLKQNNPLDFISDVDCYLNRSNYLQEDGISNGNEPVLEFMNVNNIDIIIQQSDREKFDQVCKKHSYKPIFKKTITKNTNIFLNEVGNVFRPERASTFEQFTAKLWLAIMCAVCKRIKDIDGFELEELVEISQNITARYIDGHYDDDWKCIKELYRSSHLEGFAHWMCPGISDLRDKVLKWIDEANDLALYFESELKKKISHRAIVGGGLLALEQPRSIKQKHEHMEDGQ